MTKAWTTGFLRRSLGIVAAAGIGTAVMLLATTNRIVAQQRLAPIAVCNYYSNTLMEADLFTFKADAAMAEQVDAIASVAAMRQEFAIYSSNVNRPVAAIDPSRRAILYNQYDLASAREHNVNQWPTLAVLAHQMAHHYFRHSLSTEKVSRVAEELEADKFSGTILRVLGATPEQAISALVAGDVHVAGGDSVYPKRDARLSAVRAGWRAADLTPGLGWSGGDDLPRFDLPPPHASAMGRIPIKRRAGAPVSRLADVANMLEHASRQAGYTDLRYWAVKEGFAAGTAVEQINPDGSARTTDRWSLRSSPPRIFSLASYLHALFAANRGLYRLIVFVASPDAFSQNSASPTFKASIDWLWSGLNRLPPSVASVPFTDRYEVTALIYEFEQPNAYAEPQLQAASSINAATHLQMAGLWQPLTQ